MEVLTALTVLVGGAGIYLASKIFPNFRPGNKRVDKDISQMRKEIEKMNRELVPLSAEEFELFSINEEDGALKKGFTLTARGVFTTLYHEAIAAYSYKRYISNRPDAVLVAKTAKHQFTFRTLKKGTQVGVDSYMIGTLKEDGGLYGTKKGKLIAQIKMDQPNMVSIMVGSREVAGLVKNPDMSSVAISQRAFEFVRSDMTPEEQIVMLALVIHYLVQQKVREKES